MIFHSNIQNNLKQTKLCMIYHSQQEYTNTTNDLSFNLINNVCNDSQNRDD